MTKGIIAGAILLALGSTGSVRAQTCASSCTAQHAVCAQSGKDYATCMGVWRQCKMACLAPARAATPAPPVTSTVARR